MRYCLGLRQGRVEYGWDEVLLFFGSRFDDQGREVDYHDALVDEYDPHQPLHSLLAWMARTVEVFDECDIEPALEWLLQRSDEDPPNHLKKLIEVLDNLRVAAECRT